MRQRDTLSTYRRKRDFARTPEPAGARRRQKTAPQFVIQKHAARRLHYDLRLELGGVLKSWAVPKGPSLDPKARRLAVQVEDHPIEYASFEGVIPAGQYGGGTVIVWDRGSWQPENSDPEEAYRRGKLDFVLKGEKLSGRWTLVRLRDDSAKTPQWLLIKDNDAAARPGGGDITELAPQSVLTRRTVQEVAADSAPQKAVAPKAAPTRKRDGAQSVRKLADAVRSVPDARPAAFPREFKFQLATLVHTVPDGERWLHEVKYDGYRLLLLRERDRVEVMTRGGQRWTARFASLVTALQSLPPVDVAIDGEAVVLEQNGISDFQALQNALSEGKDDAIVFYAFDLLYCAGHDLRHAPLLARKLVLQQLLQGADSRLRYSEHIAGDGGEVFRQACTNRLEGVVSKLSDAAYRGGRTRAWVKLKCVQQQEFVIAGYSAPQGSREGFGALALGYYERPGRLKYAGRVGTGFTAASLRALTRKFAPLRRGQAPFATPVPASEARHVQWLAPTLVAEVQFTGWTRDGHLRHPVFHGLREDKSASAVRREAPRAAPASRRKARVGRDEESAAVFAGVTLSHPDKVLYPGVDFTKRDLARYYLSVAERMLPHIAGRPLSLVRCPQGHQQECFFQKHFRGDLPAGLRTVMIEEKGVKKPYAVVSDISGIIALVQIGVLEIHAWGAHGDQVDRPDLLVFDLDPAPDAQWEDVLRGALLLRIRLGEYDLDSFVRTSGGKGVHVVVPIARRVSWDQAKAFTRAIAEQLATEHPDRYIAVMSKAKRGGKVFIDYLRNGRSATSIATYSTRARMHAPVAVPLTWEELPALRRADQYTVANVDDRLKLLKHDPWREMADLRQALTRKTLATVLRR